MYKRRGDGTIVGVLIDFDLAVLDGSQSTNTERTGTMVFMALDILASITADTYQLHLYRHDAESFLWVAIWVCGTYSGGNERQDALFKYWAQGDAQDCHDRKLGFLHRLEAVRWSKGHQTGVKHLRRASDYLGNDEDVRSLLARKVRRAQIAIQEAGGVVEPEVPESPQTYNNRIENDFLKYIRVE
jgi:hypothetical protein